MPWRSLRPPLKPVKIPLNIMTFHGFQQRPEGHIPLDYIGNSSSSIGFSTDSGAAESSFFLCDEAKRGDAEGYLTTGTSVMEMIFASIKGVTSRMRPLESISTIFIT